MFNLKSKKLFGNIKAEMKEIQICSDDLSTSIYKLSDRLGSETLNTLAETLHNTSQYDSPYVFFTMLRELLSDLSREMKICLGGANSYLVNDVQITLIQNEIVTNQVVLAEKLLQFGERLKNVGGG